MSARAVFSCLTNEGFLVRTPPRGKGGLWRTAAMERNGTSRDTVQQK